MVSHENGDESGKRGYHCPAIHSFHHKAIGTEQAIVDYWVISQNEISDIFEKMASLETTVAKDALRDACIIIVNDLSKKPKAFYLQWKDFERWGVEFNRWKWSPKG